VDVSDSLWLPRIMHGYRATFPPSIRKRLPITKPILTSVTSKVSSLDDMNGSVAFLVAWAGFLRVGEITYNILPSGDPTFTATKFTRSDIAFAVKDQYAILRLKRIRALRLLFNNDVQPPSAPLFRFQNTPLSRTALVKTLRTRPTEAGLYDAQYAGHSIRRGAAQHASDNGMLDEQIQTLGRWLNLRFQTSRHAQL
jgi:hypothetical protein